MVPDTRPSLSVVQAVSPEGVASAERWRHWQQRNAVTSRNDAKRAGIVFTVIFVVLGAWLGRLLLFPSL